MSDYFYKCFDCSKIYNKNEIEKNLIYLCPSCGKVEKNKPLRGILLIEYDYSSISRKYSKKDFLKLQTGKFWLYDFLWPINFENYAVAPLLRNDINRLALPSDCLLKYSYEEEEIFVLDDTRNPTLSFKDRASSLVALKAFELGIDFISAASTGNAGSSLAGICARLGLKSSIFVPKNIPEAKRIQIQSFGAELVLVDGDYDLAFDICLEISSAKKWYNRNTAYNPLTIEGKKSAAFDIFISTKGKMPDIVFVPTGDGVVLSGLYKGLWELRELKWIEKIPKLVVVQANGANAVVRYFANQRFEYMPAKSIADSISAGAPRCLYLTYDSIIKSNGEVIEVTDEEILNAQKYVAQNYGIMIEPSSSSTFAAYKKYILEKKIDNQKALLLFTGNGLKDTTSLKIWNQNIDPSSSELIKEKFLGK